jgi:hypothetical protein
VVIADGHHAGRRCASQFRDALPLDRIVQSGLDGEDARDLSARIGPIEFTKAIIEVVAQEGPRARTRSTSTARSCRS